MQHRYDEAMMQDDYYGGSDGSSEYRFRRAMQSRMDFRNRVFEDAADTAYTAEDYADDVQRHAVHDAARIESAARDDAEDIRDFAGEESEREGDAIAHFGEYEGKRSVVHARHVAAATVARAERHMAHGRYRGPGEGQFVDRMEDLVDAVDDAHADAHEAETVEHVVNHNNRMLERREEHGEHVVNRLASERRHTDPHMKKYMAMELRNVLGDIDAKLDDVKDEADDIRETAHEKAQSRVSHASAAAEHIMEHAREEMERASEDAEDMKETAAEEARNA